MNTLLVSSLLGIAALLLQIAASKETLKVSVSVWPPGSNIYLGECVLLQCSVDSNSTFAWSYRWLRHELRTPTPSPRHLVSGGSYSITAVTKEDGGSYRCQATRQESNTTSEVLLSRPAALSVSELPPPSLLTLTPNTRQILAGELFTVRCPASPANSSGWTLRRFSAGRRGPRKPAFDADQCSSLGGVFAVDNSDACMFTATRGNGGLYWCEGAKGRSNAVCITVSYGTMVLRTPAFPASEGNNVVLYCQYWTGIRGRTIFFKNGAEIGTCGASSGSDRVAMMTLENVMREDEGSYKCASRDRRMESPESWLSVRSDPGNFTSSNGTAAFSGSWIWISVSCGIVLLILIPVTVGLVCHYSCCRAFSKGDHPGSKLPATTQDVTEVQWDLSWMEMTNLLDKQDHAPLKHVENMK